MQCFKTYYITIKCEQMGLQFDNGVWQLMHIFSIKLPLKNEHLGSGHYARILQQLQIV